MKLDKLNRRHFLQGIAGASLALPSLPSLLVGEAMAQAAPGSPVRFICLTAQNSAYNHEEQWYPRGFPNRVINGGHHNIRVQDLTSVPRTAEGGISAIIGPRFNGHLDKISFLRGLDLLPRFSHNEGAVLGNFGAPSNVANLFTATPTIDQVMAYSDRVYDGTPRLRSVQMSTGRAETKRWGHQNPADPSSPLVMLPGQPNPRLIFNDLFGDVAGGESDPRISILDRVLADFRGLTSHPRLSVADRRKVEAHAEMIFELEQRFTASVAACERPSPPRDHRGFNRSGYPTDADLHQYWQDHVDVVTTAMKCGMTKVATAHITQVLRGFSVASGDITNGWHAASHEQGNPVADQSMVTINKALAEQVFLKFVEALDVPEAGGRTYLDNTVLMWCNENSTTHATSSMPVLMAGGGGGRLRQGQYIDFSNRDVEFNQRQLSDWRMTSGESVTPNKRPGLLYTRLFVSIMQAMGLRPQDYERRGVPGYGEVDRGTRGGQLGNYDLAQRGNPLPYYFTG